MPTDNYHHIPKFTLADCDRIQRDVAEKRATPKQLAQRHGVSQTIIYKIVNGDYGVQLQAKRETAEAQKNRDTSLCPGCGLPTGDPCLVCSAHENAAKSSATGS